MNISKGLLEKAKTAKTAEELVEFAKIIYLQSNSIVHTTIAMQM